jgi:putative phage-type endonuclease
MLTSTSISEAPVAPAQGTVEWLAWREQGIGGSELPIIMGESEYDTAYGLWRVRTKRDPKKETNYAMTIGLENEAKARALYELQTGDDCPPQLFQHPDLSWARCSLDGWIESKQIVVELKVMGREKHQMVREGRVPETYRAQLQWQLFVTGAKCVHFVSLNPETMSDVEIVAVTPDLEYWPKMIEAAAAFWQCLLTDIPPPLSDRDFKVLDDAENKEVFERWKVAKFMVLQLEDTLEQLEKRLAEESTKLATAKEEIAAIVKREHPKVRCSGVKAFTVQRKNGPALDVRLDEKSEG